MADQGRLEPLAPSSFFEDGRSARSIPAGTVARGQLREDQHFYRGIQDGKPAATFPLEITRDVLQRGRQRYNIFCAPCHDRTGAGRGIVAVRGFERLPASFHEARLREAPPGYFYGVIANGFGLMNDYAAQIPPEDRWAIVAYIRALQLSQHAEVARLQEEDLQALRKVGPQ